MATSTQPQRMVIRHLSGSKASQVEEFPLDALPEITRGRSEVSHVAFDPGRDGLVSRHHATIARDAAAPTLFTLHDLDSSNGMFVNKQRVMGVARLRPTNVVQFGEGGPLVMFALDPRPSSLRRQIHGASGVEAAPMSTSAPPAPRAPCLRAAVCLMTQGGRTAEVYEAGGQRLRTLGSECLPLAGQFRQTYTLTIRHDSASFAQPVLITHRHAWIVQLS